MWPTRKKQTKSKDRKTKPSNGSDELAEARGQFDKACTGMVKTLDEFNTTFGIIASKTSNGPEKE